MYIIKIDNVEYVLNTIICQNENIKIFCRHKRL